MNRTVLLLVSWFSLSACGEGGSGVYASDSRELPAFFEVENRGEANLYLSVEPSAGSDLVDVTVTGDDNLIDEVRTYVAGDTLIVDTDHAMWPVHELRVVATVPRLADVDNDGSGDIHVTGVDEEDLALFAGASGDVTAAGEFLEVLVRSSGSGDVDLSGSAEALDLVISGSGDVNARGMTVLAAEVIVSGSGDAEVCVTDSLDAVISGSGDIDYYCDPDIIYPNTSGSGQLAGH